MWVTHTERAWRRKEEAKALAEAARSAEARIAGTSIALSSIQEKQRGRDLLARCGFDRAWIGRSSRVGKDGRSEGIAILESIVIARVVEHLMLSRQLVLWLATNRPSELIALNDAVEPTRAWRTTSDETH
jgi:hypothetical protein